jgi:hypothetical protein
VYASGKIDGPFWMLCGAILYAIMAYDVLHPAPVNYHVLANKVT